MRQRLNPIFIILNNGTYAVEEVCQLLPPTGCWLAVAGCCLITVAAYKTQLDHHGAVHPIVAALTLLLLLQMIHPGEYNVLKVWDYVKLAEALSNDDGTTFAAKVGTCV